MGRFDALTQIDEKPITPTPSLVVASPTLKQPQIQPQKKQGDGIKKLEGLSRLPQTAINGPRHMGVNKPTIESKPQVPERPNGQTSQRSRRIITRNSFEIYEDQMESLRKLSYREKMDGNIGSMSGMVREAIDNYLLKKPQEN